MSYINPDLRQQFESLSIDLKNALLTQESRIDTLQDLIAALEKIASQD